MSAPVPSALEHWSPAARWQYASAGLMFGTPGAFLAELRRSGALARLLPEVERLFGVPQLSDGAEGVIDLGLHALAVLDETARAGAPLAVRFAALMHHIGKGETPREIWPSHYRHEQRGQALLEAVSTRLAVPADALQLARLVIDEADRIHRASDLRAGALSALLERTRALEEPERFEQLLCVCSCDYAAYAGHSRAEYPKAPKLRKAAAAYRGTETQGLSPEQLREARALSVARALRGSFVQG